MGSNYITGLIVFGINKVIISGPPVYIGRVQGIIGDVHDRPGGGPSTLDPSKLINLSIFDPLWVYGALGNN